MDLSQRRTLNSEHQSTHIIALGDLREYFAAKGQTSAKQQNCNTHG
jgi:hypothetical protein